MNRLLFPFRILLLGALLLTVALAPAQGTSDQPTSESLSNVRIDSLGGLQMEIWVSGRRVGFTPLTLSMPAGSYPISALGDTLIPVIKTLTVDGENDFDYALPALPLTTENQPAVSKDVIRRILDDASNRHLLIMCLMLGPPTPEATRLIIRADRMMPGDPMVDALRARVLVRQGRPDDAMAAVGRSLAKLPRVAYCWKVRAEVLLHRGELAEALASANQAVLLDPEGWRSLRVRAKVHDAMGKTNLAEIDNEQADELYGRLHELASAYEQEGARVREAATQATPEAAK